MKLRLPDGTETKHTLTVCGIDSKTFARAKSIYNRKMVDFTRDKANQDAVKIEEETDKLKKDLVVACVKGWSFDEPFTENALRNFFSNAPYQVARVDIFIGDRSHFFEKPSNDSATTLEES